MKKLILLLGTLIVFGGSVYSQYKDTAYFTLSGQNNRVFKKLRFTKTTTSGESTIIGLINCSNITFDSCEFNGAALIVGLKPQNCSNITVKNCVFNNTASGVYAIDCGNGISVTNSRFINMTGPLARGQAVQFNRVNGTGLRINCNYIVNELGKSYPEDLINLCSSSGTAADPIQVKDNYMRGGGPSLTGGGIMSGDCGGGGYQIIENNVVIDPGQYGVAIAGGKNIQLRNNKVYGKQQPFTNVGLYVADYSGGDCDNHIVTGNQVYWFNSSGGANPFWSANTCTNTVITGNSWQTTAVTANMPPPACAAPSTNLAPTANAGTDKTITLPTSTVSLTGSGTDPDGSIIGYTWSKVSGPAGGTIASPNAASTNITALQQGTYVFRLTVFDNAGATATDDVQVTVNAAPPPPPPNQAPSANAGANQTITLPTNTVSLTGSGTDPDGAITGYAWIKASGPAGGTISAPTAASTNITGLQQGVYVYRLTVTDNNGATATDDVQVTVNAAPPPPPNQPPVANAGSNQIITLPTNSTTFNGSGTDADGTIATYIWTKVSGPAGGTITAPGAAATSITALQEGTYVFRLTVTDNAGATATDDVQVIVNAAPAAQQTITTREVTTGLTFPWEILWGKDNSIWMTERNGKISKINPADGAIQFSHTITEVVANGEGGLLGMVQHPDFLNNGYLYVVYNYNKNGNYTEKVVRFTYANNALGNAVTIIDDIAAAGVHNGSRLLIVADKLFITTGDAANSALPQDDASRSGKVLRLNLDGTIPADNPVAGNPMWSKGLRNSQGLVFANNIMYSSEHGPDIEDEINIIEKSRNYGWPNVNGPCDGGETTFCNANNVKAPLWSSGGFTIAVCGLDYYNNNHLPEWKNSLLLATLKDATFYQYQLSADGLSVVNRKEFFRGNWGRLRDIAVSPDGKVYICTSNGGGNDRIIEVSNSAAPLPNQPPVANAGADKVITLPTNTTTFNGTATDADGTIATYVWSKVSGPAGGTIATANAATTNITALQQGVYVFRLTVTDDDGATDTDDVQVTVNAAPVPNQPPVANAGADKVITLPTNTTSLTGTATDADGTIATYAWSKVSGPAGGTIATANAATTNITALQQGVYVFRLTVTDDDGATDTDDVQVTVNAAPPPTPNQPPVANAGADKVITLPTNTTTLNGSGTDADGTITAYNWTKISGPVQGTIGSPNTAATQLTNLAQGVYQFRLRVTDNGGATGSDTVTVTVNAAPPPPPPPPGVNQPPVANAGSDIAVTLPVTSITLDGKGSYDPDGTIASWGWVMVQGSLSAAISNGNTSSPLISNLQEGVYEFELTVTDNNGAVAKDKVKVTVSLSNESPVARVADTIIVNLPVQSAELDGSGSFDPDGTIDSYVWAYVDGPVAARVLSPTKDKTVVTDLQAGTYTFELTIIDDKGAPSKARVVVIVKNSTSRRLVPTVSMYPNPASDNVNLAIETDATGRTSVTVFDLNGRPVHREEFVKNTASYLKQLDVSRLPKGSYLVVVQVDIQEKVVKRLVKILD
ncbi:MAG: PQQ-dependent sugar dehydrogenase [Chitinophagaceae bacterium]|nr:PQQ-dependent sugar dehydrogenase [Chitinophagaceae bacterium]